MEKLDEVDIYRHYITRAILARSLMRRFWLWKARRIKNRV